MEQKSNYRIRLHNLINELSEHTLQLSDQEILNDMDDEDRADIEKVDEIIKNQIEKAKHHDNSPN
jgi:hypothetical protein